MFAVFTFIPTAVELVVVCALLSHQVGAAAAGIVLLAFLAYVIWTVKITTAAALSRIKVCICLSILIGFFLFP